MKRKIWKKKFALGAMLVAMGVGVVGLLNITDGIKIGSATEGATITVESVTTPAQMGSDLSLSVDISNNPGFAGANFELVYDSTVLTPKATRFTLGSSIAAAVAAKETNMSLTPGTYAELSASDANFTRQGQILTIEFTVNENITKTSTEVSLKLKDGLAENFCNFDFDPVPVSFVAGTIAVEHIGNACVVTSGGSGGFPTIEYATLNEALQVNSTWRAGYQIKMLRNSEEEVITYGRADALDLNGFTIDKLVLKGAATSPVTSSYAVASLDSFAYEGISNGTIKSVVTEFVEGCTKSIEIGFGEGYFENVDINGNVYFGFRNDNAHIKTLNDASTQILGGAPFDCGYVETYNLKSGTTRTFSGTLKVDKLNITGTPALKIDGGTYGFDPTPYLASPASTYHYEAQKVEGKDEWNVVKVCEPVFVCNGVNYDTCYSAMSACPVGGTVTLGSAYTSQYLSLSTNKYLDLAGKSIQTSCVSVPKNGHLINSAETISTLATASSDDLLEFPWQDKHTFDGSNIIFKNTKSGGTILGNGLSWFGKGFEYTVTLTGGTYVGKLSNYDYVIIQGGSYSVDPRLDTEHVTVDTNACHLVYNSTTGYYDAIPHTWDEGVVTTNPTCTEKGVKTYHATCAGCEEITKTEEIPALGHAGVHHDPVAPTCTEDGIIEYWQCSRCHKYFGEEACETELTAAQLIDPQTGHDYDHHICDNCNGVDESTKFYLDVKSGNEVYMVVGDDYNATFRLPEDGEVDMSSVTIKAIMQNVASLGVEGTRTHEITINTGLTGTVDLREFLSHAYSFDGGTIKAYIDGKEATYTFSSIGTDLRINAVTSTSDTRTAWQALTSHVSTSTQAEDDSYVNIANGSYIKIETEFLRFEDGYVGDLRLDNFNDFSALETKIREAVTLDTCEDQEEKITLFVKAGTQIAVGQTVATLDDDYKAEIYIDSDSLTQAGVYGIFTRLRACTGAKAIIKQLVKEFDNVIYAIDLTSSAIVGTHEHELTHVERKEATCTEAGNIEYWYCEECGQYYSDAKGYIQIAEEDTIIPATGHTLEEIEAKAPTCTEDGWKKAYFCDDCDIYFSDAEGKNTIGDQDDYIAWRKDAGKEEHLGHDFVNHVCERCGCIDDATKFYFEVESGNKVYLVVGNDYGATVRLPLDGNVGMDSVTLTAIMQDVASLGVEGTRKYSITINTGLTGTVNLEEFLSHAYDFEGAQVTIDIDGNDCYYNFLAIDSNLRINTETDTESTRAAWQALTSHITTSTQAEDDSYVVIVNGSYIKIGTEFLRFEDGYVGDLKLDNFNDFAALEEAIREAIALYTCEDQEEKITVFVKAGTTLAVGNSIATLDDDYMMEITLGYDALDEAGIFGIFARLRACVGAKAIIKGLVQEFNKVIYAVDLSDATDISMHVHELEYVAKQEATCTEVGYEAHWYCAECDGYYLDAKGYNETTLADITIPIESHDLVKQTGKPATCTEVGWKDAWLCSGCGMYYADETGDTLIGDAAAYETWKDEAGKIPMIAHDLTHVAAKDAKCLEAGNIEYWYCDECHQYFSDAQGQTVITQESTIIPALGHDKEHTAYKAATCTEVGNIEYWYCNRCEKYFSDEDCSVEIAYEDTIIPMIAHTLVKVPGQAATCTADGYKDAWKCSECNEYFTNEQGTISIGDADDYAAWILDSKGGKLAKHDHTLTIVNGQAAQCLVDGYKDAWHCSECNQYFSDENGAHVIGNETAYNSWKVGDGKINKHVTSLTLVQGQAATCTADGYKDAYTCSECGKFYEDANAVTLIGNVTDYNEWATNGNGKIAKHAHTANKINGQAETCCADGYQDAWKCSECNQYFSDEACSSLIGGEEAYNNWKVGTGKIAKHPHAGDKVNGQAATCTEAGWKDAWKCSECNQCFSDSAYTALIGNEAAYNTWKTTGEGKINAKGHQGVVVAGKAETCCADGYKNAWRCSECGLYFSDSQCVNLIGNLDAYNTWKTTGAGRIVKHAHAGDKYNGKAATCTEAGYKDAWKCSECNQYFADMSYSSLIGNEAAYITWRTTGAGKIDAKGHKAVLVPGQAATCTEAGYKDAYKCLVCEKYFSDSACTALIGNETDYNNWITLGGGVIAKHAHTGVKVAGQAETCTTVGYKDAWKCSECGQYFSDSACSKLIGNQEAYETWKSVGGGMIPTHAHTATKVAGKEATCTEVGYRDAYKCSECNQYFSDSTCLTLIGGEVAYNTWKNIGGGKINELGHSLVYVEKIEATREHDGVKAHYECSRCGKLFVVVDGNYKEVTIEQLTYAYSAGCGGSVVATSAIISILSLAGAGLLLLKRRKED